MSVGSEPRCGLVRPFLPLGALSLRDSSTGRRHGFFQDARERGRRGTGPIRVRLEGDSARATARTSSEHGRPARADRPTPRARPACLRARVRRGGRGEGAILAMEDDVRRGGDAIDRPFGSEHGVAGPAPTKNTMPSTMILLGPTARGTGAFVLDDITAHRCRPHQPLCRANIVLSLPQCALSIQIMALPDLLPDPDVCGATTGMLTSSARREVVAARPRPAAVLSRGNRCRRVRWRRCQASRSFR